MKNASCIPGSVGVAPIILTCLVVGSSRADLNFEQPIVDLGEVRAGVPLRHVFRFSNPGREAVEIVDARGSCGCLATKLATRTIAPSCRGDLTLEINTLGLPSGPHFWRVHLHYRQGNVSYETQLQVTARVVAEVVVQPAALTIFADRAVAHEIVVTDLRTPPLAIEAVTPSSRHLRAELSEPRSDTLGRNVRRIGVVVEADFPEGRYDETVSIQTNDPTYRELRVPVTIVKRARQRLTALPAEVVANVRVGQPVPSRIVLIRDAENQPVRIERAECDHPAVGCQWASGPGNQATLRVTVDRERWNGRRLEATVTAHVTQPEKRTLTIPVRLEFE